jgi:hypothetical protein
MFTATLPLTISVAMWLLGGVQGWVVVVCCAFIAYRDGDCRTEPNGPVRGGR